MKNALAKTNEPVIDPATMSPIQLYEAIDSKQMRPQITLALPSMLVRELKYGQNERDSVDHILKKEYIRQMKSCKQNIKETKEEIERLQDDEAISFNLQDIVDIEDVDIDTVLNHGETIFPEFYKKFQKIKKQQNSKVVWTGINPGQQNSDLNFKNRNKQQSYGGNRESVNSRKGT